MRKSLLIAVALAGVFAWAGSSAAGGKADGERCNVSKSCDSKLCVRVDPGDKFGTCCRPQDCPELGAQCGLIDNGCGVPTFCGLCDFGSDCIGNQCVPSETTTTTTSTTTTTTTSTTTTTDTVTTTTDTTTTTTLGFPRSCVGFCGQNDQAPPGDGTLCYCDALSCSIGDGCFDRDTVCPEICGAMAPQ